MKTQRLLRHKMIVNTSKVVKSASLLLTNIKFLTENVPRSYKPNRGIPFCAISIGEEETRRLRETYRQLSGITSLMQVKIE